MRRVVDHSTIERHLLTQQTDPFSRKELALEQVTADHALQERIQAWLRTCQQQQQQE